MKSVIRSACVLATTLAAGLAVASPQSAAAASPTCNVFPIVSVSSLPTSNAFSFDYGVRVQCSQPVQGIALSTNLAVADQGATSYQTVATGSGNVVFGGGTFFQETDPYRQSCAPASVLFYYTYGQVQWTPDGVSWYSVTYSTPPASARCDATVDSVSLPPL